jgi:bacillolysin
MEGGVRVGRTLVGGMAVAAAAVLALLHGTVEAQSRPPTIIAATTSSALRSWDASVDLMLRDGSLRVRRTDDDTLIADRVHERMDQYYDGVRVFGGDVTRQTDHGLTLSIFGTMYEDIALSVDPAITSSDAAAVVKRDRGVDLGPSKLPQLVILPEDGGAYRLVYHATAFSAEGGVEYFIDARDGSIVRRLDAARRQSAIGTGTGVLGDTKKMSVTSSTGLFLADDLLRPPAIRTFDMHENLQRVLDFLNGRVGLGVSDRASDSDNTWTDRAAVDAHAHAGYVYDYFFKRFNRHGLDNNNFRMLSLVHPVPRASVLSQPTSVIGLFYVNAFYAGDGVMVYGEGLPTTLTLSGQRWDYLAGALDVCAHELSHGVTEFTSNLIYQNESGALNESFSDMMGTSVEFFYQPAGNGPMKADYLVGEDVIAPGGVRSMENPGLYGQPDHYSRRVVVSTPTDANDNGGVHANNGIGNQAYYLAIEGGTNRTSGLAVQGVGAANRDQIEKVMYRGFTQLMPANATYSVARAVTIQSATDLYGANSSAVRAITQAWTAVGVN